MIIGPNDEFTADQKAAAEAAAAEGLFGTEPLRLPAPLADPVTLAAVQRLLTALAPTQSRGPRGGRLFAPTGRDEHGPMTVPILPAADIELLSAAAALGHSERAWTTVADPTPADRAELRAG